MHAHRRQPPPHTLAVAALYVLALLTPARPDWVEISQSHYRKPLKTALFTTLTTERAVKHELRNQTLGQNWGKGQVYRADIEPARTTNTKTGNKRINPFLARPSVNNKPNRIEIRRPSTKIHEPNLDEDSASKPYENEEIKVDVHRKNYSKPNRVILLDSPKPHATAVIEPVKKPVRIEGLESNRRVDVLSSSEPYESATSSEQRIRVKGKIEAVAKPDKKLLTTKKPSNSEPTVHNKNNNKIPAPTIHSKEPFAHSISDDKLVFETPKPEREISVAQVAKEHRSKKPNRIYINTLGKKDRPLENDNISSSTETQTERISSSTESEKTQLDTKFDIGHHITSESYLEDSSQLTVLTDSRITSSTNDYSSNKDNFKRLDVTNLDFKDPEFVTKYETFEMDDEDDTKYADVIIEAEPSNSKEPFVGGDLEDHGGGTYEHSEEPVSSTFNETDDNNENEKPKSNGTITNETKPNPMENVVKLMKVVADTITRNTRNGFKGKINYLESLRDSIMSNIKAHIDATWPDDSEIRGRRKTAAGSRRSRQARGHVEFPSSEGALMTISFLTFAVFLIKLVLQVISTYKNKAMMVSPAVFAVSRAAAAAVLRSRNDNK